jgi:hypothetical protein
MERFNRTLLEEWAYARLYRSNTERRRAFRRWLRSYNHRRPHTSLDGLILQPHLRLGGDAGRLRAAGTRSELICWDGLPCRGRPLSGPNWQVLGQVDGLADYLVRAVLGLGWGWLERSRSL